MKTAGVRLDLEASGFLSSLRTLEKESLQLGRDLESIGDSAAKASNKTSIFTNSLKSGFQAGKSAAMGLLGDLKNLVVTAGTLGGALSIGKGVSDAMGLREVYKQLQWQIHNATGETKSLIDIQRMVEQTADATGQKYDAMGKAFANAMSDYGDLDYAKVALLESGKAALVTGKSFDTFASATGRMKDQLGANIKNLPNFMKAMLSNTETGGATVEFVAANLDKLGAQAEEAGFKGAKGFAQLLGVVNALEGKMGSSEKAADAAANLFSKLKTGSGSLLQLGKNAGIKFTPDMSAMDKVEKILSTDKAHDAFNKMFKGDLRVAFDELTKPFTEAVKAAKGKGASAEEAAKMGLESYRESIKKMAQANFDRAKFESEAAARLEEPKQRLTAAINNFTKAFEKPEIAAAIDKIAEKLPQLATMLGDLVGDAVDNPKTTAGVVIGAKVLPAALGAATTTAAIEVGKRVLGKGAAETVVKGGARAATAAVTTAEEALLGSGSNGARMIAGKALEKGVEAGAVRMATQTGLKMVLGAASLPVQAGLSAGSSSEKTDEQEEARAADMAEKRRQKRIELGLPVGVPLGEGQDVEGDAPRGSSKRYRERTEEERNREMATEAGIPLPRGMAGYDPRLDGEQGGISSARPAPGTIQSATPVDGGQATTASQGLDRFNTAASTGADVAERLARAQDTLFIGLGRAVPVIAAIARIKVPGAKEGDNGPGKTPTTGPGSSP